MYPFSKLKSVLYMGNKKERCLTKGKKGEHLLIISKFSLHDAYACFVYI